MSRRRTGNENERKVVNILEAAGFEVERSRPQKFGPKDFFNLWDIQALRDDYMVMIQVTTNKRHSVEWRETAYNWCKSHMIRGEEWVSKSGEFVIYKIY